MSKPQYTTEPITCRICGHHGPSQHRCRIDLDAQLGVGHSHPFEKGMRFRVGQAVWVNSRQAPGTIYAVDVDAKAYEVQTKDGNIYFLFEEELDNA